MTLLCVADGRFAKLVFLLCLDTGIRLTTNLNSLDEHSFLFLALQTQIPVKTGRTRGSEMSSRTNPQTKHGSFQFAAVGFEKVGDSNIRITFEGKDGMLT